MLKAAVSRLPKTTLDTGLMRGTNMLQSPQRQTVYRGTRSGAYDQSQGPYNLSTTRNCVSTVDILAGAYGLVAAWGLA